MKKLLKALVEAYDAACLVFFHGGNSYLTEEQRAYVIKKYPNHLETLGDQRRQKLVDALDKVVALSAEYKKTLK